MSLISDILGGGAESLQYCAPMPDFKPHAVPVNAPTGGNMTFTPDRTQTLTTPPVSPWTDAAPTVEGVYWLRFWDTGSDSHWAPIPVVVMDEDVDGLNYYRFGEADATPLQDAANALWQGPITPPGVEGE